MGLYQSIFGSHAYKKETRVIMLGLKGSGKTEILKKLRIGEIVKSTPAVGYEIETAEYKNINFTSWDVDIDAPINPNWHRYLHGTKALIWVVNSANTEHTQQETELLRSVLDLDELRGAALLVFANKQELPNAQNYTQVSKNLGLRTIRNRSWHIQASNLQNGDGLYEGLVWLAKEVMEENN